MEKPPLARSSRLIIGFQVMLAIVFAVIGVIDASGGGGWSDLARLITVLLAGIYLLAVSTVAAVARYLVSNGLARGLLVTVGPPTLMVIAVFAIRGG